MLDPLIKVIPAGYADHHGISRNLHKIEINVSRDLPDNCTNLKRLTEYVISRAPSFKDGNFRFTTIPLRIGKCHVCMYVGSLEIVLYCPLHFFLISHFMNFLNFTFLDFEKLIF